MERGLEQHRKAHVRPLCADYALARFDRRWSAPMAVSRVPRPAPAPAPSIKQLSFPLSLVCSGCPLRPLRCERRRYAAAIHDRAVRGAEEEARERGLGRESIPVWAVGLEQDEWPLRL